MPERSYQKTDLAREQLEVALGLFLDKVSYVAALTLAGAAEEILGKALSHKGDKNVLKKEYDIVGPIRQLMDGKKLTWASFMGEKNRARNSVKHMDRDSESTLAADLEDETLWMLVRACDNYRHLGLDPTDKIIEFDEWFYKNVVGV